MAWKAEAKDALTRDGRRARFVKEDGHSWPCPWVFLIDGETERRGYSIGGFYGNHQMDHPYMPVDLVGPWPEKIAGRTLHEWKEFAKRDDCLDQMVPSDLRRLIAAIN